MKIELSKQQQAALASYGRSVLAAVLAVAATGNYAVDDLVKAALAAALPPLLRWANPHDKAFGRVKKSRRS
jgi:hypothetical protein